MSLRQGFLVLLCSFLCCLAYATSYTERHFTTDDGLPSNEVYCVIQDSLGYIWIATDKGIACYVGITYLRAKANRNTERSI